MFHLVSRYPARGVELGLDLFTTHFLCDIRYADPKHTNWGGPVSGLIVHRQFNFVGLVDIDTKRFILPSIGAGRLRSCFNGVFDLEDHERLRAARESGACRMIYILDSLDAHRQKTRQGLAHVGAAETLI